MHECIVLCKTSAFPVSAPLLYHDSNVDAMWQKESQIPLSFHPIVRFTSPLCQLPYGGKRLLQGVHGMPNQPAEAS